MYFGLQHIHIIWNLHGRFRRTLEVKRSLVQEWQRAWRTICWIYHHNQPRSTQRLSNLLCLILSSRREYICRTWRQSLCNGGGRQIEDGDKNPLSHPPHLPRLRSEFSDTKTNSLTLSKLSLPALADLERGSMWPSPSLTQPQIWWLCYSLVMERAETG